MNPLNLIIGCIIWWLKHVNIGIHRGMDHSKDEQKEVYK
jgi:hypothetical protein